jgi:hypothetical protein
MLLRKATKHMLFAGCARGDPLIAVAWRLIDLIHIRAMSL